MTKKLVQFANLFKKYRLKSEFKSLKEFGDELARLGFIYEDSLLSHWQNGRKIPNRRQVLFAIIFLFKKRIKDISVEELNEFLQSANQGFLTNEELEKLQLNKSGKSPFLVPPRIKTFFGRRKEREYISANLDKKIIIISGQAGIGKTALAIELGHSLRYMYPDGVLWFRLDISNVNGILDTIADVYDENFNKIDDLSIKIGLIRSLLSSKKALIILDNAETEEQLLHLIPNTSTCGVIITSQKKHLLSGYAISNIELSPFTQSQTKGFFTSILGKSYVERNSNELMLLCSKVKYLPLIESIFAHQLSQGYMRISSLVQKVEHELNLDSFYYDDSNLFNSLHVSISHLESPLKSILLSLGIFSGDDFSAKAIAFLNNISEIDSEFQCNMLCSNSLLEHALGMRYRLHPAILRYISKEATIKNYDRLVSFYEQEISKFSLNEERDKFMTMELRNIFGIFDAQSIHKDLTKISVLWDFLAVFLWNKGYWTELNKYARKMDQLFLIHKDNQKRMKLYIQHLSWCLFWQGSLFESEKVLKEGIRIAKSHKNYYWIAFGKLRYSKIKQAKLQFNTSDKYLQEARLFFQNNNILDGVGDALTYLAENKLMQNRADRAIAYLNKALEIVNSINDFPQKAIIYSNLGTAYLIKSNYKKAKKYFLQSQAIASKINRNAGGALWINLGLGLIQFELGRKNFASRYFRDAKTALESYGMKDNIYKTSVMFVALNERIKKTDFYNSPLYSA